MGATAADYDGDGKPDVFRTNFSDERETLYHNRGAAEFDDATIASGLAHNTRFVGWGCGFFDFDNDGWKDLLLVNGHAFPEVERLKIDIHYKDRAILYRNNENGTFTDVSERAGPAIIERHAARGAAFGDYSRVIAAPLDIGDCFKLIPEIFNIADRFQCPGLVLCDLLLSEGRLSVHPKDLDFGPPIERGELITGADSASNALPEWVGNNPLPIVGGSGSSMEGSLGAHPPKFKCLAHAA